MRPGYSSFAHHEKLQECIIIMQGLVSQMKSFGKSRCCSACLCCSAYTRASVHATKVDINLLKSPVLRVVEDYVVYLGNSIDRSQLGVAQNSQLDIRAWWPSWLDTFVQSTINASQGVASKPVHHPACSTAPILQHMGK